MHAALLAGLLAAAPQAAAALESPEHARLHEVLAEFRDDPGSFEKMFSGDFLQAVPPAQLAATFADFHRRLGTPTEARRRAPGKWEVSFSGGYLLHVSLEVDGKSGLIRGLLLSNPIPLGRSIEELVQEAAKLPGKVSVRVERLLPKAERIAGVNDDQELAIGSTFKLYVLGELARQVKEGRLRWDQVVLLDGRARSWPSGELHTWPVGTPVTVQTLATLMISKSDNTATDQLLALLGRERVEAVQTAMGHSHPERNRPFLSTAEMFRLKDQTRDLASKYLRGSVAARREILSAIDSEPRQAPSLPASPAFVDSIEWFASAQDLCKAMAHLASEGSPIQEILSVNPGISIADRFAYVGYKGGSETGVLDLTWLARTRAGSTYAVSLGWNDPKKNVDEHQLLGLGEGILSALADR